MTILPKQGYHLKSDRWLTHWKTNWWILKRKLKKMTVKDWILGAGSLILYIMSLGWSIMLIITTLATFPELLDIVQGFLDISPDLSGGAVFLVRLIPLWWLVTVIMIAVGFPWWVMMKLQPKKKGDKEDV